MGYVQASPGSVPSTRSGVGLSDLSMRRHSTGGKVPMSHEALALLCTSPSITEPQSRVSQLTDTITVRQKASLCIGIII